MKIRLQPSVLQWARNRAQLSEEELAEKFSKKDAGRWMEKIGQWESDGELTYKQAESLANKTRTAFGYLFLPQPPDIPLPLADFRTVDSRRGKQPSPELLDTIHAMQRRQDWLSEERQDSGAEPLHFIGSALPSDDPDAIGREMRRVLGLDHEWAKKQTSWTAALGKIREVIEGLGVMAVINGVVGNNTSRKLDVGEFRGFALSDPYAPLIFVNGADAKSAQMFTLAHELAHLWLGESGEGLSGFIGLSPQGGKIESFCDQAAAEFLVPAYELRAIWPEFIRRESPLEAIAPHFKVSPIVIGRRCMDLNLIGKKEFLEFYQDYTSKEFHRGQKESGGGDFYNNQNTRVGSLFATQVIRAAKEGRLGFGEAYDLSGLSGGTFQKYAEKTGYHCHDVCFSYRFLSISGTCMLSCLR